MLTIFGHCLVPFLALLVAFIPLVPGFLDHRPVAKTSIVALALICLFILQSIGSIRDDTNHAIEQRHLQDSLDAEHAALQTFSDMLGSINRQILMSAASIDRMAKQLQNSGLPRAELAHPDAQIVARSVTATRYVGKIRRSGLSRDVDIIYFPKKVDGPKVIANLEQLGYTVKVGQPVLPGEATNAMWIGDAVSIADARAIGLTLMRAGVVFQSVKRFCIPSAEHANTVEIGTNFVAKDRPALTARELSELQPSLPRDSCTQ